MVSMTINGGSRADDLAAYLNGDNAKIVLGSVSGFDTLKMLYVVLRSSKTCPSYFAPAYVVEYTTKTGKPRKRTFSDVEFQSAVAFYNSK